MEESENSGYGETGQRRTNPRPESTMALDFSSALDGAFNMNGDLLKLGTTVEDKKQNVKSQSQELEELEARLKAAEERLKEARSAPTPGAQEPQVPPEASPNHKPPSRIPPRAPGASLAAGSVSDRVPTPMDPSHSEAVPGAASDIRSGRQQAARYYEQRSS